MLFNIKREVLAQDEIVLQEQYVHWWIFIVPGILLLFGFYLWFNAVLNGSFSLYSLIIFDEPKDVTNNTLSYYIQFYLYQGSHLLQDNMPDNIYEFLNTTHLHPRKWLSQLVIIYALYRLIRAALTYLSTRIMVTNHRVLIETGLLRPQIIEFPKMHVDAFHIKKGILSRFLNVGTVIIQASGGLTARIPAIKMPQLLTTNVVEND